MSSDDYTTDGPLQTTHAPDLTGPTRLSDLVGSAVDGTRAVISQADALMRRHRVFVAGGDGPGQANDLSDAAAFADDLPVLTEIVESLSLGSKISATDLALIREHQRVTISSEISKWAEAELTTGIHALVDELTGKLVATLTASAKSELLERLVKELDSTRLP